MVKKITPKDIEDWYKYLPWREPDYVAPKFEGFHVSLREHNPEEIMWKKIDEEEAVLKEENKSEWIGDLCLHSSNDRFYIYLMPCDLCLCGNTRREVLQHAMNWIESLRDKVAVEMIKDDEKDK